jgi:hypothetical protein
VENTAEIGDSRAWARIFARFHRDPAEKVGFLEYTICCVRLAQNLYIDHISCVPDGGKSKETRGFPYLTQRFLLLPTNSHANFVSSDRAGHVIRGAKDPKPK